MVDNQNWREKMNTEEREYRGTYLIKIRKDGRIRIPADLKWNHGDWLELTAYGFKDSIFITHIRNIHEVNIQRCMCCGRNYPVKKELSIPDAETKKEG